MKWSIQQLYKHTQGDLPFDEIVDLQSVKRRNPEIRAIEPVRVSGTCSIGSFDIECQLQLDGMLTLPCARTWEDVPFPFTIQSTEAFSWDPDQMEDDEEVHQVEGDVIDFHPILEELILLEIPLQVYSEKAKSMKRMEGKGWSYMTDEEYDETLKARKPDVDPRLAGLADLFDKNNE